MTHPDPRISKYFSELAKKRKHPYYHFKDKNVAKTAGDSGRKTQRANREKKDNQPAKKTGR